MSNRALGDRVEEFVLESIRDDMYDALEHVQQLSTLDFSLYDFEVEKHRCMPVDELDYYDDIYAWLEFEEGELKDLSRSDLIDELTGFRGNRWAKRAMSWLDKGFPPIVIVRTSDVETIGDGRGRVNLAIGLDLDCIPAVILTHKSML